MITSVSTDYKLIAQFSSPNGFVYQGDCRGLLRIFSEGDLRYRLIFADPPFGIGVDYDGAYDDNLTEEEYEEFSRQWITQCSNLLLDGGRLYVHVPDSCVLAVLLAAREAGLRRDEWLIWHYRFGQNQRGRYINSKCHGLVFVKPGADPVWCPENVLETSDRASRYNDPRTKERDGSRNYKHQAPPGKRVPFDVWGSDSQTFSEEEINVSKHLFDVLGGDVTLLQEGVLEGDGDFWGRVPGNSKERRSIHKNQLPERYLKRILLGYTVSEDWVLDPFGGSGTTAVVAKGLGRNFVTIEQSELYANSIAKRIELGPTR